MLADIAAIRALAAAHSGHAADLDAVAATLRSAVGPSCAAAFGPIGARFVAALAEAVARDAAAAARLGERMTVADHTAAAAAVAYDNADGRAGRSITTVGV
ncbi:type VII secretion target [Mycobacterium sp. URHB0044]|uniref:type VII secretion target n=1 Tax=Mycobacterium sp. URHB0044 TaxID=1380386 RepID=UPI00048D7480|nr:type VII secretion target [Mycobacterium sp. URHB0044]